MNFQISGFIMNTRDPMNLHVENVYIDFHATMGGFVMRTECNYPEAYVLGNILFNNVTCENPIERIAPFREAMIITTGSENLTVNNTKILYWGSLAEDRGQIEKHVTNE